MHLKQTSFFPGFIGVLGLLHAVLFVFFWLTNHLFYADVNNFIFENLGKRWDYIRLALLLSAGIGVWSLARLLWIKPGVTKLGWGGWFFTAMVWIYLIFFYGSFWVLFQQSPIQGVRLERLAKYFRIVLDVLCLFTLAGLSRVIGKRLPAQSLGKTSHKMTIGIACLVVYSIFWSVPLIIPPASVFQDSLPPKPLIIAHRGASILAPENTLAAAKRALEVGADGLEVDIRISLDGVPFLMHDSHLWRTTDVIDIFPERVDDPPEAFTMAELKQLSAGSWFSDRDPYQSVAHGLVSQSAAQEMRNERIPTLVEVLDFMRGNEMLFIFDLLSPPEEHPYVEHFFDICFDRVHQAGFDSRVWFLAKGDEREKVVSSAPEMILTYGADYKAPPEASLLVENGYKVVNVDYGMPVEWISKYHQAGLKVNLYVVDETWMFSELWLAGADSMTTNNVHTLVDLDRPVFSLSGGAYLLIWGLAGLLGLGGALSFLVV